jgi:hypothetical protein
MSLAICAEELITEPSASASSAVILDAKLELNEVNEPLINVFAVEPNVEFHTPVPIVPTDVILVCPAVARVPSTVEAATLPNEPVAVDDPLYVPTLVIVSAELLTSNDPVTLGVCNLI